MDETCSAPEAAQNPLPATAPEAAAPKYDYNFTFGQYAKAEGMVGVGFWPRVLARVIDLVAHYVAVFMWAAIFGLFLAIVAGAIGVPFADLFGRIGTTTARNYIAGLLGAVIYHWLCVWLHGSSLGKMLLGMVVLDEGGKPCGSKAALGRELAYFVDALFFGFVGYLAMSNSGREQRYGDQWNHTLVVKRAQADPAALRSTGRFVVVLFFAAFADAALLILSMVSKFAF
jgi:uncharacterized RDD family membrane protein YckC